MHNVLDMDAASKKIPSTAVIVVTCVLQLAGALLMASNSFVFSGGALVILGSVIMIGWFIYGYSQSDS